MLKTISVGTLSFEGQYSSEKMLAMAQAGWELDDPCLLSVTEEPDLSGDVSFDAENAVKLHRWISENRNTIGDWVYRDDFWYIISYQLFERYMTERWSKSAVSRMFERDKKRHGLRRLFIAAEMTVVKAEDLKVAEEWSGCLSDSPLRADRPYELTEMIFSKQDIYENTAAGRLFGRDKRLLACFLFCIKSASSKGSDKITARHIIDFAKRVGLKMGSRYLAGLTWKRLEQTMASDLEEILTSQKKGASKSVAPAVPRKTEFVVRRK